MAKFEWREIKTLNVDLFVRAALNQDRALYFGEIVEAKTKEADEGKIPREKILDPILITATGRAIDGRHRIEGCILIGVNEIYCEISSLTNEVDIIEEAWKRNKGSLAPSRVDHEHTIMLLRSHKLNQQEIAKRLGLPTGFVRNYIKSIQTKETQRNLTRAAFAMGEEEITATQAAEKFGVTKEALKAHLQKSDKKSGFTSAGLRKRITFNAKSYGGKQAVLLQKVLDLLNDGELQPKDVEEIFAHMESANASAKRSIAEWRARFKALVAPKAKAS